MPALDVTDISARSATSGIPKLVMDLVEPIHRHARGIGTPDEVRTAQLVAGCSLIGQAIAMLAVAITGDPRLVEKMPLGVMAIDITKDVTRQIIAAAHAAAGTESPARSRPMPANPTLADLATLAAEVLRLGAPATPGPWTTEASPRFGGAVNATIDGDSRQVATAIGDAPMHEKRLTTHEIQSANAALIAAYRTACPALAAFTSAIAPALAEWVAAHRTCDAAGEAVKASIGPEAGREGRAYLAAASVRDAARRRLTAADRALRVAAAGMVAP